MPRFCPPGIGIDLPSVAFLNVQLDQPSVNRDHVDRVRELWAQEMPDLDTAPLAVIARLGRVHAYVDAALHSVFAKYGLTRQGWDVLASLRRIGPPYRLTPTELHQALMRTSGAITHTLHRLEHAGLIQRVPSEHDGRSLLVALTAEGKALLARAGPAHLANQRRMLDPLTPDEQATLAGLLRKLLLAFEEDQTLPETPSRPGPGDRLRARLRRGRPPLHRRLPADQSRLPEMVFHPDNGVPTDREPVPLRDRRR